MAEWLRMAALAAVMRAVTLSAGHAPALASARIPSRAPLPDGLFPRADSTVPAGFDSGAMAFGTTALVMAVAVTDIPGVMRDFMIRTGGGILVRRLTTTSSIRLAWRTR